MVKRFWGERGVGLNGFGVKGFGVQGFEGYITYFRVSPRQAYLLEPDPNIY